MMRVDSHVEIQTSPDVVRPYLEDLARYPEWMPLVHSVIRDNNPSADPTQTPEEPAWIVELRTKVGPLARSKKLRMCRTVNDHNRIVFERAERDGRRHSPWTLTIGIAETAHPDHMVTVTVALEYGGSLWTGGILDKILASHIDAGREGLRRLCS